jgi:hypothetical protein
MFMSFVTYCVVLILLCHDTHEELCPHTCHTNGLWQKLWSFCILWVTESHLNWMRETVYSVSYVETLTRTNQSIACLFRVSFSLLFTPLTMNMKNVLVIMQWRGSLYVILHGGVMWCLDCMWHVHKPNTSSAPNACLRLYCLAVDGALIILVFS